MLRAWVAAEADSPRYRADYDRVLDRSAPLTPEICRHVLGQMRGYPDRYIFNGLPHELGWSLVRLTVQELGRFRFLNYRPTFAVLSPSRLVSDGAANLDAVPVPEQLAERVRQTEVGIAAGDKHTPLIAVTSAKEPTPILLEGNTRATAYLRCRPPTDMVDVILGISPGGLSDWEFV